MPNKKSRLGFAGAAAVLKRLNVEFRQTEEWRDKPPPRRPHALPFFKGIKLPFTPEEWCDLMMNEGRYYVGGCCGTSSAVQDILGQVFRFETGWMDVEKLAEVAMLQVSHGERKERPNFKDLGDLDAAIKKWTELDPWQKLAVLWHLIKDCYVPKVPSAPPHDLPPVEDAIDVLQTGLQALSIHRMFVREETPASQDRTERLMALYRLLPAIRTLHDKIGELDPGPLEGYALIDREQGGKVAENGYGLCVYWTRAEAEKMLESWRSEDSEHKVKKDRKPIDERIGIRPVRVSSEKGLEFLDDVAAP
jgi:hypothetical protein